MSENNLPLLSSATPVELDTLANTIAEKVAARLSNQRRLLSRHEMSKVIGISITTLDRMLREGNLPSIRVGRKVLFDPHAVIEALSKRSLPNTEQ